MKRTSRKSIKLFQTLLIFLQALGSRGDAVRETTTTKTMYRAASPVIKNAGNMSELDSLLQDLSSSSKYAPVSPASKGKIGGDTFT